MTPSHPDPTGGTTPSLDHRTFEPARDVLGGEVTTDTRFHYRQDGSTIWAHYAGGHIQRGHLIGTRHGDTLDFRYVQLNDQGHTATGHCRSHIRRQRDGRLTMTEHWQWESKPGSGTSTVVELIEHDRL